MADKEKAVMDSIFLNRISKKFVRELIALLDKRKLQEYLSRFKGSGKKKMEAWLS